MILVIGSEGQIGSELVPALCERYGEARVVAADIRPQAHNRARFRRVDIIDRAALREIVKESHATTIYNLVSILSANGEKDPELAWRVNMEGLRNIIEISRTLGVRKVFWPSSIAAFGPRTPRTRTPQITVMDPTTMYGITKASGELLCQYASIKYGLDVRCLRYPGILSWKTPPGGGTTDYAIAMVYEAVRKRKYTCFLRKDSVLPMMYMPDAIRATLDIMDAPSERLRLRSGYNLAAISFSPGDLEQEIQRHIPSFTCKYEPDERQRIADSWPRSINDTYAREDFNWRPRFTLRTMVADMLANVRQLIEGEDVRITRKRST